MSGMRLDREGGPGPFAPRLAKCAVLACVIWIAGSVAAFAVQYTEGTVYDPTPADPNSGDECLIEFVVPQDTPQGRADVGNMRTIFEFALDNSDDMKAKVKEACQIHGRWIQVVLFRDSPKIEDGETYGNGVIVLDPGDLDANKLNTDGDPVDVQVLQDWLYLMTLAHEFDHNRDLPGEDKHDDPSIHEILAGKRGLAVDDENEVMKDIGIPITRRNYGRLNPFNGKTRVDFLVGGRPVMLKVSEHFDSRSAAHKFVPAIVHTLGPSLVLFSPGEPCLPGGSTSCYPLIGDNDADHDGVPDSIDNCIDLPNPRQSDWDGDGIGSGCDRDDDGDGADRGVEAGTGSADYDPNAGPEHWSCAAEPMACASPVNPCTDTVDNDLDGLTDLDDPGCAVPLPGGIDFPESTPLGQLVPDYHREDLGGVPERQDALLITSSIAFDYDLDGIADNQASAAGVAVIRHDEAITGGGGVRSMEGSLAAMRLHGFDPTMGDFLLNSHELFDFFFSLTSKQAGSDFPATGLMNFTLELDSSTFGQLDQASGGLQSTFVPQWQPYETNWTFFGSPMIFSPAGGGSPVVQIVDMTLRFERDSDFDGSFDPADNCPDDPNPGQADSDSDGTGDVCDCGASDGDNWGTPPGATLFFISADILGFSADGPPGSVLDVVDVVRTASPDDFVTSAVCAGTNLPPWATGVFDPTIPAPGEIFHYLGQLENGCPGTLGQGPTGFASNGVIHLVRECD